MGRGSVGQNMSTNVTALAHHDSLTVEPPPRPFDYVVSGFIPSDIQKGLVNEGTEDDWVQQPVGVDVSHDFLDLGVRELRLRLAWSSLVEEHVNHVTPHAADLLVITASLHEPHAGEHQAAVKFVQSKLASGVVGMVAFIKRVGSRYEWV